MTMGKTNPSQEKGQPQQPPLRQTPPNAPMLDHSFTLQAVMEVQKSIGQLTEATRSMRADMDKQSARLDKIDEKLSGITHKLYAASVVLAIALAAGAFLLNKSWDRALDLLADQIKSSQQRH